MTVTELRQVRRPGDGKSPAEAPIDPDVPVCDPHHHLMDRKTIRYFAGDLLADLAAGHNIVSTMYVECGEFYRDWGPAHLRAVGEIEYVVAQPVPDGVMAGLVARADLRLGDAVDEVLDALTSAAQGRLRGVRFSAAWDRYPPYPNMGRRPHLLAMPEVRAAIARVAGHGLPLDCWVYAHQLDELIGVARAFPDQVFVLDHLGNPVLGGAHWTRRHDVLASWHEQMRAVAGCANVMLKLGGFMMPLQGTPLLSGDSWPQDSAELAGFWAHDVELLIDWFGPDRCLFESNFPVDGLAVDYVRLWNAYKRLAAPYSTREKGMMLHDNAVRIYRLPIPRQAGGSRLLTYTLTEVDGGLRLRIAGRSAVTGPQTECWRMDPWQHVS